MNAGAASLAAAFVRDGFVFPIDAMSTAEASANRAELEAVEPRFPQDPRLSYVLQGYCHHVLPFVDEIMRRPAILGPVAAILGDDLLVWGCSLFIKEALTPDYVTWHQDLTYWGLDSIEEVTAWVALSPATRESGCMRFVPGSHLREIVEHRDTFAAGNMLSRGQQIAVEVDESEAVDVTLRPGQVSLHHGRTFHGSHANRSNDRRIGLAIRYIAPSMKQTGDRRTVAVLVRGEDRYGHFELAPPPSGTLAPADMALLERAEALQHAILYEGAARDGR
jgi:hypothetical protein